MKTAKVKIEAKVYGEKFKYTEQRDFKDKHVGFTLHYWCPACNSMHETPLAPRTNEEKIKAGGGDVWAFKGTPEVPTVHPSIHYPPSGRTKRCHAFLEAGKLRFLPDSEHPLVNQIVDVPELPPWIAR